MALDIEDDCVKVRLSLLAGNRARLQIDYPCEDKYRDQVRTAVADLIRPKAVTSKKPASPAPISNP